MLLLGKPSQEYIRQVLAHQSTLPFSYPEVGASRDRVPANYPINYHHSQVGVGEPAFIQVCDALRRWQMYTLPWTEVYWPDTPITAGSTVGVLAGVGGLWTLNISRIIYIVEEGGPIHRYGFAFGTLPQHVETGEERFIIEWHRHDNSVWYELFAFARPHYILAKIGFPMVPLIQKLFAVQSERAIRAAVQAE
jgi:uncharacterized protein (UPF0548 family)